MGGVVTVGKMEVMILHPYNPNLTSLLRHFSFYFKDENKITHPNSNVRSFPASSLCEIYNSSKESIA